MHQTLRSLAIALSLLAVFIPAPAPAAIAPLSEAELTAGAAVIVTGKVTEFTVTSTVRGSLEIKLEVHSVTKGGVKPGATLHIVSSAVALKKHHLPIPGPQGLDPLPKKGDTVTAYLNPDPAAAKESGKSPVTYHPLLPNGIVKAPAAPKPDAESGAKPDAKPGAKVGK